MAGQVVDTRSAAAKPYELAIPQFEIDWYWQQWGICRVDADGCARRLAQLY
jgi:hypothetical protein